jgi:hemerythrin
VLDGQGQLLIVWHEPHLTGIQILDEQHRGIVSIINTIHHSIFSQPRDPIVRPAAAMVMGYTRIHFQTEMDLLEESGYPRREEHQRHHEQLIRDFTRILDKHGHFKIDDDPQELLDFLKDWWLNHITAEDMAYSGHLKEYLQSGRRVIIKRNG